MVHADKLSSDKLFVWETICTPPSRTKKSRGDWQHMVLGHADHNRGQLYIPSPEEYCLSIVALSTIIGACRSLLTFGYPVHSLQTSHHIPPTLATPVIEVCVKKQIPHLELSVPSSGSLQGVHAGEHH